ncbi:DDE-type integrase/transposase/recombinase [Streptomyces scopuliridis]|uniref:DDE-type integrase/transposase/recombinase n=1 Tax=Streptomyces scopuliridis TaxID=452529 RepID=A0ACD4ZX55_9ACTN|nr:Mu transposase C-terminal domain-containing protein [Streptomyces scopuliridis]WSC02868.1 DDE-type integrase/transposase/recombinase [Streptomyces scopuliridis]WSC10700.1 DDE-type integrase/transposase/recombinase [Streptomyces scopuliridis]
MVEVGGHIIYQGRTFQVAGLQGQQVYLLGEDGTDTSLLSSRLFADPGFEVVGARSADAAPQWGLFETVPLEAQQRALAWLPHIREVETGWPHPEGSREGQMMREEYDPERWTLAQREAAKAREMTALGFTRVTRTTVQKMRYAYREQGLWGLVDKRTVPTRGRRLTGYADERVVAAVLEALRRQRGRSKGTVKGLQVLVGQILEETHGRGVVELPSRSSFYRLVSVLADPAERPGRPARAATGPVRGSSAPVVLRPGEQVQIDTTRLDVMAVLEDGSLGRPEMSIAVDVATRSILAAVLRPHGTKVVDAALLLAEMAVPHPARPSWPAALHLSRAEAPYERMLSLDKRLHGAAARPVIVPETIVVDRGKIYISESFVAACETLGVSVQPAPPRRPQAKGVVERTFGAINDLFCQHVAGHTGSNPLLRGKNAEAEACWTIPQLQDFLDEWIVCWQNRPHDGLRHPVLPKTALTPNQMWAALIAVCGYVPVPLTGADYLELLPVRWQPITERGIRIDYRTYNHEVLDPHRGQRSDTVAKDGKWEVHHNPHDVRQIWVRLSDGQLHEIGWIHREHVHQPFSERIWRHVRSEVAQRTDREHHEADLADALGQLLRRTRGMAAAAPKRRGRKSPIATPGTADVLEGLPASLPTPRQSGTTGGAGLGGGNETAGRGRASARAGAEAADASQTGPAPDGEWGESLDDLAATGPAAGTDMDEAEETDADASPTGAHAGGYGLWNAEAEAEQW